MKHASVVAATLLVTLSCHAVAETPNTEQPAASGAPLSWAQPEHPDNGWAEVRLPGRVEYMDALGPPGFDGAVWFRRTIEIPASWSGRALALELGAIDDVDVTWFDGVAVGSTGRNAEGFWRRPRRYSVPASLVEPGEAVLAVRLEDFGGPGGFTGSPEEMTVGPADAPGERLSLAGTWRMAVEFETPLPALSRDERVAGLVTYYLEARTSFALFDQVPELDWDAAFLTALREVEEEQDAVTYYRALQRFASLLRDSHCDVVPPQRVAGALDQLPIDIAWVDGTWVVVARWPVEELLQEDVPIGSVLVEVRGYPTDVYFRRDVYPFTGAWAGHRLRRQAASSLRFAVNDTVTMLFRTPDGREMPRTLRANRGSARWTDERRETFDEQWPLPHLFEHRRIGEVHYIYFGACNDDVERLALEALDTIRGREPLILDIRGNVGGVDPMTLIKRLLRRPVSHLIESRWNAPYAEAALDQIPTWLRRVRTGLPWPLPGAEVRMRDGWLEGDRVIGPSGRRSLKRPLIVLIDGGTVGAGETIVAFLREGTDAVFVGEPTAGSITIPHMFELPGGGQGSVGCSRETIGGARTPCAGFQPDVRVPRTIQGTIEGRDEALEAALELLDKR
jgi:hypothetical protein